MSENVYCQRFTVAKSTPDERSGLVGHEDGRIATLAVMGDEDNVPIYRDEAIALRDALTKWLGGPAIAEPLANVTQVSEFMRGHSIPGHIVGPPEFGRGYVVSLRCSCGLGIGGI